MGMRRTAARALLAMAHAAKPGAFVRQDAMSTGPAGSVQLDPFELMGRPVTPRSETRR
jgi:hypothetical protein